MKQYEETEFVEKDKQLRPIMVKVHDPKDPEKLGLALKKLKRIIKDSKMMVEYQEHLEFKRPGQAKREKRLRAKIRARRAQQENP
jgi:ribosomal protein S21